MKTDFWELFNPLPKQVKFLKMAKTHRYMLYGGARGGGKSKLIRWGSLYRVLRWGQAGHKHVRVGIFSEDYPTLRDRQVAKIRAEFPDWLGQVRSTQDEGLGFYLRSEYGGGAILLRNLDDPSKYQSAEFAGVAVEELTKNPVNVFDVLRGSLRWPGIPDTYFWGATNPGGIGHLWVRALWIDRDYTDEFARLEHLKDEFGFVQSLPADNPYLDDTYWEELNSLPEVLRRAWVEGDWTAFKGQAFPEWRSDVHVAKYEPEKGADRWRYEWWGCGDWGSTAPGVLYLMATGPERTLARYEWKFKEMDPYTVGYQFGQSIMRFPKPKFIAIDTPPVPDGGPTILERLQEGMNDAVGGRKNNPPVFINIPRGPGSRLTKKQLFHELLAYEADEKGEVPPWNMPELQFHPTCTYAIRTIPALPLAENTGDNVDPFKEDVDTHADDHPYDALSGGFMARIPQPTREQKREPKDPDAHPGFDRHGNRRDSTAAKQAAEKASEPRWSPDPTDDAPQGPRWSRAPT